MTDRLDPFTLAFEPFLSERFEAMRTDLAQAEVDIFDRDAWALSRSGGELLQELRPEDALGEGVQELIALAHAAFVFWQQGERVVTIGRDALDRLLRNTVPTAAPEGHSACYVQLAPRRVWGTPVPGGPAEPLDGWFAVSDRARLNLVAIFGLLPGRPGFTVALASGPRPGTFIREDGSAIFSPVLEGGHAAGLWSVIGGEELLELGWRVQHAVVAAGGPGPGRTEVMTA